MLFDQQVVLFDTDAKKQDEALSILADHLQAQGVVTDAFKAAILEREQNFPTALQTETVGVAIPHTDADKVITPQIGFMRLKTPVTFHQMGDNAEVKITLIFMLALKQSEDQLSMLQTLMGLFQNPEAIGQLETMTSTDDFLTLMKQVGSEK